MGCVMQYSLWVHPFDSIHWSRYTRNTDLRHLELVIDELLANYSHLDLEIRDEDGNSVKFVPFTLVSMETEMANFDGQPNISREAEEALRLLNKRESDGLATFVTRQKSGAYLLVIQKDDAAFYRGPIFRNGALNELIDWGMLVIRGTSNGHVPDYNGKEEEDSSIGGSLELTPFGVRSARAIFADEEGQ